MADNFFKVKNGLNLPTLGLDPTVTPPANSAAGDMAFYNGKLYIHNGTAWGVKPGSGSTGLIVNADVDAAAAIDGTKVNPAFGTQNITTTGSLTANSAKVSSFSSVGVVHNDASGNLSTSSIVNADVSATAAIDGTKVNPNFGSQAVATTGSISASSATVSGLSTAGVVHNSAAGALSTSLVVNADVSATAAIAGTKVDPNFGAQNVSTSGNISTTGNLTANGASSKLYVDVNSVATAVEIRQLGSGNALTVVDDNSGVGGTDPSVTIIDANGNVGMGVAVNATLTNKLEVLGNALVTGAAKIVSGDLTFDTAKGIESHTAASSLNVGTGANTSTVNIGTGAGVQTVNIGTGAGTTTINIGGTGDTVVVSGTLTTVNTTNLDVADKNITLNKGGTTATAAGAGLTIEGTSGASLGTIQFDSTLTSDFKLGPTGSEAEVVTVSHAQTLTNKTLTTPTIGTITAASNTLTISGTGALTLPTGTTAQQPTGVNGMIRYNSTNNAFEGYAAGAWSAIGGSGSVSRITQNSHGFSVGHVLAFNGTNYVKAQADTSANAEVVGMISRVVDANTFEMTINGQVSGLTGLTSGGVYFLDPTTAGAITLTEPTVVGQVSVPLGVASSTTALYVAPKRGVIVGSANARTKIYLANNATTNVQSVSAYEAGELAGWVYLDGTVKYRFYVQAQFALNAAGTDYNLAYQTTGDTPPAGFSVGVTTVAGGSQIQVTVPSGSFNAATSFIQFALNAPAVGATLPLAIDSSLVQFSSVQAKDVGGISVRNAAGTTTNVFVSDAGNVGIGTSSPGSKLHINTGTLGAEVLRLQGGTGAFNDPYMSFFKSDGSARNGYIQTSPTVMDFGLNGSAVFTFTSNSTERARIDASGNLLVGTTTSPGYHEFKGPSGSAINIFQVTCAAGVVTRFTGVDSNGGWNASTAGFNVSRSTSTGRSINATGTINASGADYAEYMTKAGDFTIAKGDLCGINAEGKLTNVFSEAVSFVVKSTNPSYVGGDSWGAGFEDDAEGLEAARQLVDRIAFCGQVPVNVLGATPGQYIVPVEEDGKIKGMAVSNPTFEQYQAAVGRVIAVEEDGRARIIVKIA